LKPRIGVIVTGCLAGYRAGGFFRNGRHRVMIFGQDYRENACFGDKCEIVGKAGAGETFRD
jgi:hypothetical protein